MFGIPLRSPATDPQAAKDFILTVCVVFKLDLDSTIYDHDGI
jgi:hypothetical protein